MTKAVLQFNVYTNSYGQVDDIDYKDELNEIVQDYISILDEEFSSFMAKFDKTDSVDGYEIEEISTNSYDDKYFAACIWFEGSNTKEISDLLNSFKHFLRGTNYSDTVTVYGKHLWGGYPSYDPPEYEEFECEVECSVDWISNEIEFIEGE